MSGGGEGRRAERRRGGKLYELTVVKCPQTNPITEEEVRRERKERRKTNPITLA